jgi:hypothetical protein
MYQPEDRIVYLRNLLQEDPDEPFLHYAICLELKKNGGDAGPALMALISTFPGYLPGYFQAALFMAEKAEIQKAVAIAADGVLLAEKQGDQHALAELKGLRQDILAGEYD